MQSLSVQPLDSLRGIGFFIKTRHAAAVAITGLLALSSAAFAGDASKTVIQPETSAIWEKPAWLTDLSLRVGESFDTNVYVAGATIAPGDDVALRNKSSWVTTISPKIGFDFAKLFDKDSLVKSLTLGYSPDFVIFHDASSESYSAERVTAGFKLKADNVSVIFDNAFTYINGSDRGLKYTNGANAYGQGTTRERRDQWQERSKLAVKIDAGDFFFRPTVSLLDYNLDTKFLSGYANYIDRYDLNGGADLGYNVSKNVAFTLGYRYGHQYQQTLPTSVSNANNLGRTASSDYQRVLFGVEGTPIKWLKLEAQVGPQFTKYGDDRPYIATVASNGQIDEDKTDVFAEVSATISVTKSDVLVLKYKRWNWVSSTGVNPYVDSLYDASFRHQITKDLQLQLGLRATESDYNPASLRDDWLYTASAGLRYNVTKNLIWDITYSYDEGANDQYLSASTGPNSPSAREFDRSIISTGITWAF